MTHGRYTLTFQGDDGDVIAVEFCTASVDKFLDKVTTFMQQIGFKSVEALEAYRLPTPEDLSPEAYDFRYGTTSSKSGEPEQMDIEDYIRDQEEKDDE